MKQEILRALGGESCDLSSTLLTQKEQEEVLHVLAENKTVTSLAFDFNDLSAATMAALSNVLRTNLSLKFLSLTHSNLDETMLTSLFDALRENVALEQLDLSFNALQDEGIQSLCNALSARAKKLTHLSLKNCSFGEEGALNLGRVMSLSKSLKTLDITGNSIGDNGLSGLLKEVSLSTNSWSLERLVLWGVGITTSGVGELIRSLRQHPNSMQELVLSGNPQISAEISQELVSFVKENNQIHRLEVLGSKVPRSVQQNIHDIVAENAEFYQESKVKEEDDIVFHEHEDTQKQNDKEEKEGEKQVIFGLPDAYAPSRSSGTVDACQVEKFSIISFEGDDKNTRSPSTLPEEIEKQKLQHLREQIEQERLALRKEREEFMHLKHVWTETLTRKQKANEQRERIYQEKIAETEETRRKLQQALQKAEQEPLIECVNENGNLNGSRHRATYKVVIHDSQGNPINLYLRIPLTK